GEAPSATTNPYLAVARHAWSDGSTSSSWQASFTALVSSHRSSWHSEIRTCLCDFSIALMEKEDVAKNPFSCTDLFRGVKARVTALEQDE
ncbi:unnamed protein product, partial [Pylaiella littoralis]